MSNFWESAGFKRAANIAAIGNAAYIAYGLYLYYSGNVAFISDVKKELLQNAKPITEMVTEKQIDFNGDIVETQRLDTIAYQIRADKLKP